MLSSIEDWELSEIDSNLNKPDTRGSFTWHLHPCELANSNQIQPNNYWHTERFNTKESTE
jgi:hypothetical protein